MEEKRGSYLRTILHNLMARGVWPGMLLLSIIFVILGINKPDVSFSTFTGILYIGFIIALLATIYYVYRE